MAKTENLIDGFDSAVLDTTTKWVNSAGTYSVANSDLSVAVDGSYNYAKTAPAYSLQNSYAVVNMSAVPSKSTATVGQAVLATLAIIQRDTTSTLAGLFLEMQFEANTGTLKFRDVFADVSAPITFSLTTHKYWKIREGTGNSGNLAIGTVGRVYFDTSPDGITWTNQATENSPAWITSASDCMISLTGHRDGGVADVAKFASLNTFPKVPGAPTGVTGTVDNTQSTITWAAPAGVSSATPVTSYTVTCTPAPATGLQSRMTLDGTTLSYLFTGLLNGTSYTFTVTATNVLGTSPPSTASSVIVPNSGAVVVGVPTAPTAVSAAAGNASAIVTWTASTSSSSAPITDYLITPSTGVGVLAGNAATTYTFTGLTNGTPVTFVVQAKNSAGFSLSSAASTAVTPAQGTQTYPLASTLTDTFDMSLSSSVWADIDPANPSAVVAGALNVPAVAQIYSGIRTVNIYSLVGTSFSVQCFPSAAVGDVTAAAVNSGTAGTELRMSFQTGQLIANSLVGSAESGTAAMVAWDLTKPCWVRFRENGTSVIFEYSADGVTFTQLRAIATPSWASAVRFTLEAFNGTISPPKRPPAVPTLVVATANDSQANINWDVPSDPGTSPVTGYRVSRDGISNTGGGAYTTVVPLTPTDFTFLKLVNGNTYNLSVSAISNDGESASVTVQAFPAGAVVTPPTTSFTIGTTAPPTGLDSKIDFRTVKQTLRPTSLGWCILGDTGNGNANLATNPGWKQALKDLGPLAWRIPVGWDSTNTRPNLAATGTGGDARPHTRAIKDIGGILVAVLSGNGAGGHDNIFTISDVTNIVTYYKNATDSPHISIAVIGNEFTNGGNDPNGDYLSSLSARAQAVKAVDSTVKVSAPALPDMTNGFSNVTTALNNAGPFLDYVSAHAYQTSSRGLANTVDYETYMNNYKAEADRIRPGQGIMPSMEEFNWAPSYGGSTDQAGFFNYKNFVATASVIGHCFMAGANALGFADSNGYISLMNPGNHPPTIPGTGPTATTAGTKLATYYALGLWSGMRGSQTATDVHRGAPTGADGTTPGHMVDSSTTLPMTEVFGMDNGKIMCVNKDTVAHTVNIALGGTTIGTAAVFQGAASSLTATDFTITRKADIAYSGSKLSITLAAGTVTSLELSN